jgi:hypothetical protein
MPDLLRHPQLALRLPPGGPRDKPGVTAVLAASNPPPQGEGDHAQHGGGVSRPGRYPSVKLGDIVMPDWYRHPLRG